MAKYKVKDINKNGKIDGWEQAKYNAINKSSDSPAKQVMDPTMQQQMIQQGGMILLQQIQFLV